MSVRSKPDGSIELEGTCTIDDAETLLQHLLRSPDARVDWRSCEHVHAAVLQVLLASGAVLRGPPSGEFLRTRIDPLLQGAGRKPTSA